MTSFLHPLKDASNTGYQEFQALLALSNGHVLGEGLGASIASYGFLPNAQTDFIFAVIGEETGLLGGLVLSGLFYDPRPGRDPDHLPGAVPVFRACRGWDHGLAGRSSGYQHRDARCSP